MPLKRRYRGTVQEINVLPAIVVVVKQCDAGAWSFNDGFLLGTSGTMTKFLQAGLLGDIGENNGGAVDESSGGDGPRLGVLHGRMRTRSVYS